MSNEDAIFILSYIKNYRVQGKDAIDAIDIGINAIKQLPSVNPQETVTEFADRCRECGAKYGKLLGQKSGKWIPHSSGIWIEYYECSECGRGHTIHSDYCPNCGAEMESKEE